MTTLWTEPPPVNLNNMNNIWGYGSAPQAPGFGGASAGFGGASDWGGPPPPSHGPSGTGWNPSMPPPVPVPQYQGGRGMWDTGAAMGGASMAPQGPSWNSGASNPIGAPPQNMGGSGGWGGPPPASQNQSMNSAGWGGAPNQQSQWGGGGGASSPSNRSWADMAKQNVANAAAGPPVGVAPQQPPMNTGPPPPQGAPQGRPLMNRPPQYPDPSAGWGRQGVDQGTPWTAVGGGGGVQPEQPRQMDNNMWNSGGGGGGGFGGNHPQQQQQQHQPYGAGPGGPPGGRGGTEIWQGGHGGGGHGQGGGGGWNQPQGHPENPDMMWNGPPKQQLHQHQQDNQWQHQPQQQQHHQGHQQQQQHNTSTWDNSMAGSHQHQQQQPHHHQQQQQPTSMWNEPQHQQQQQQQQPQQNMWQQPAPQPPPPPQPRVNNSNVWEDPSPTSKRTTLPDKGTGVWGDPSGQQGEIRRWKQTSDDPVATVSSSVGSVGGSGSVWKDSPVAPGAKPVTTTPSWGDSNPTSAAPTPTTPWGDSGASGALQAPVNPARGGGVGPGRLGTENWGAPPSSTAMAGTGWNAAPNNVQRTSAESGNSDDVFPTNPNTPMTPNAILKPGQEMPNGARPSNGNQPMMGPMGGGIRPVGPGQQQIGDAGQMALTQQIADQLRIAVKAGWVDMNLLGRPLPEKALLLLQQILSRVPRLEQARSELSSLRQNPQNDSTVQQECLRIQNEVDSLEREIQTNQQTMNLIINQNEPTTPSNPNQQGSSRLAGWKQQNGLPNPNSTMQMQGLTDVLKGISVGGGGVGGPSNPWAQPTNSDWANTTTDSSVTPGKTSSDRRSGGATPSNQNGNLDGGSDGQNKEDSGEPRSGSGTPQKKDDEGPPEFKPGQPWVYPTREFYQVDDNTTPSDLNARKKMSVVDGGLDPEKRFSAHDPYFMNSGGGGGAFGGMGPIGGADPFNSFGAPGFNPMQMMPNSRPQQGGGGGGNPAARNMNRAISAPGPPGGNSAFQPYGPTGGGNEFSQAGYAQQWIVLSGLPQSMDELQLKNQLSQVGQILSFLHVPQQKLAFVRFKESNVKVIPALSSDLSQFGINVQYAKDADVDRIIAQHQQQMSRPVMPPWPGAADAHWGGPGGPGAGVPPFLPSQEFMHGFPPPDQPFGGST